LMGLSLWTQARHHTLLASTPRSFPHAYRPFQAMSASPASKRAKDPGTRLS
jgi:hypothetical protein